MKNLFVLIVVIALACTFVGGISAESDPAISQEILTAARPALSDSNTGETNQSQEILTAAKPVVSDNNSVEGEIKGEVITANVPTSDNNNFKYIIFLSAVIGLYLVISIIRMIRRSSRTH